MCETFSLCVMIQRKVSREQGETIALAAAERYLTRPYAYSGVLKDYFGQNIWGDWQKRQFVAAMMIFRVLACTAMAEGEAGDGEAAEVAIADSHKPSCAGKSP